MLGRRNLRIKVMQVLYTWEIDPDIPLTKLQTHLEEQIRKSVSLYLTNLLFLVEVCKYSTTDMERRKAKYIRTEEDEKASISIADNSVIRFLTADATFNSFIKEEGIKNYISSDIVKQLFTELSSRQKYKDYSALQSPTTEEDKEIIGYILKKLFSAEKDMGQHLEEAFINYQDDNDLILHILGKYVDSFSSEGKNNFFPSMNTWEEEKKFALDLLAKTVQNNEELSTLIEPNLRNWEMDRVAILDLILMKMALCELKYFPTVPVKVSINEYIDISKLYSTPKSKDFVNGVLDRVKNQMKERGEIKKHGRGLME